MDKQLYEAAYHASTIEVQALLTSHPHLDTNWKGLLGQSALHVASFYGRTELVKLLLAHPSTDVNLKNDSGQTPLLLSCGNGQVSVVQLLLKDPRVQVAVKDNYGHTPLWLSAARGQLAIMEKLMASGRDLGDIMEKATHWGDGKEYLVIQVAKRNKKTKVVAVLERFMANPARTRHELRVKLDMLGMSAAEVFAVIVFLCDGLFQLKPALVALTPAAAAASRFFAMAERLPMELQMVLCHRVLGSRKQNVLQEESEAAFKALAWSVLLVVPTGLNEGSNEIHNDSSWSNMCIMS